MTKSVKKKLTDFFGNYPLHKLKRKEFLLKSSQPKIDYIYFLTKGYVRQSYMNDEDIRMLNVFRPLSFFPIIFILNNIPNSYSYRAITDVEYHRAPRKDVMKFIQDNNDVLYDLTTRLGAGLNRMLTQMTFLHEDEAKARVYKFLHMLGTRFGTKNGKFFVIDFPITHREIASFTGLRRETVSREMSVLEKGRKLKIDKRRIWILDKQPRKA